MKIYICYEYDYDCFNIRKAFANKQEAIIFASENNLFVDEQELVEGMYDVSKYNFYTYFVINYNPMYKDPITFVEEVTSSIYPDMNPICVEKKSYTPGQPYYTFNVFADSRAEAKSIFYDKFKEAMDKFYMENNVLRQNGQVKTWKKP